MLLFANDMKNKPADVGCSNSGPSSDLLMGSCLNMDNSISSALQANNDLPPLEFDLGATKATLYAKQSGLKRGYEMMAIPERRATASPTAAVASSILDMRARPMTSSNTMSTRRKIILPVDAAIPRQTQRKAEFISTITAAKKTKVSRERQLKINAASRRCRRRQKMELQFLRTHVLELQAALKDQINYLQSQLSQQQRAARLSHFVDDSMRKVEEINSGIRPSPAMAPAAPLVSFSSDLLPFKTYGHSAEEMDGTLSNDSVNHIETDPPPFCLT